MDDQLIGARVPLSHFANVRFIGQLQSRFFSVVEERHQLIILAMRNRIVLVRVTLSTPRGKPQPGGPRRGNSISHRMKSKLQRIDAAFFVQHRVAMKPGGNSLGHRRIRQHIARQLFDRELIKRHVVLNRPNHPVAERPDRSIAVFFVAVGVGISSEVQPAPRPELSVRGRFQEHID